MPADTRDHDFIVINITDVFEVRYWSKKFGVTPEALKLAVKEVGGSARAVQKKLQS
jgi:hypothetical protein